MTSRCWANDAVRSTLLTFTLDDKLGSHWQFLPMPPNMRERKGTAAVGSRSTHKPQDPDDPAAQPAQRPVGAARGKRRRLHDSPPQIAGRRRPHAKLVARNRAVLANLQATCSTRVFRTVPPQELTDAAHKAARLTDTDAHIQTASRAYTRPLWYQSRVWDPDD